MPDLFGEVVESKTYRSDPDLLYAVLYTNGEIQMADLEYECYKQRWVPLLGLMPKEGGSPVLVCFSDLHMGTTFIKRNIPDDWVPGLIQMPPEEVAHAESLGWKVEVFNFPKKVMTHPNYDVVSLIHYFQK